MTIPISPVFMTRMQARARDAVRRIAEKPSDIAFRTASGSPLPVQTVRLEYDQGVSASEGVAGAVGRRKLVIFGVRGHESVPDTDLQKGYRFVRENREYEVQSVIMQLGEVQGIAEVTQ